MPNISRGFSPASLIFGGAAFALSAAMILLVGGVWRTSPVEHQRPDEALHASQALALAPTLAVAPSMPLTGDIRHDRPEATRTAPAVPAVAVPRVVVSTTPVAARGVPTATVREQSVRVGDKTPRFVGTLLIESDPVGATAFVNQKLVGGTPVLLKDLRAGSYVVRLEYRGINGGRPPQRFPRSVKNASGRSSSANGVVSATPRQFLRVCFMVSWAAASFTTAAVEQE